MPKSKTDKVTEAPTPTYSRDLMKRAREKAEAKAGFFVHMSVYVLINFGLMLLNLLVNNDKIWFHIVTLTWGIGLLAHFLAVFVFFDLLDTYTESEMKREYDKLKHDKES
jgi:hypothetical protein